MEWSSWIRAFGCYRNQPFLVTFNWTAITHSV